MIKRCIFIFSVILPFICSTVRADDYNQRLVYCLVGNTSDENKINMINWAVSAIVSHPDIKGLHSVNFNQKVHDALDKKMADLIVFIMNSCKAELKDVIDNDGDIGLERAFNAWGQIAFMLLLQNPEVEKNMYSPLQYIDLSKLKIDF